MSTPIYFLICTQPFNQKLQCPHYFLYFICTRPFDQKLGSSLINFFHLHTTILPNYRVLFHLFFLHCPTIRPKIRVFVDIFLYLHTTIWQKYMIFFFLFILPLCTTIRPKIRVLINLIFLFVHDHSAKVRGHSYS